VAQVGPLARVLNMLAAGHEPTKKYATAALDTVSALAKTKVGLDAMHSTIGRHAARAISCRVQVDMLAEQWTALVGNIGKGDSRPSTRRYSPRAR
jgi:hydrogenase large subunit